ncbi:MAG: PP2C family protein-serine/threonine phosphatase [Acidimicrobiia bacterium]
MDRAHCGASLDEHRLVLALEAGQLGTWTWDMATASTTWDARLEELHGLAPGGFGGTFDDWVEALHPGDRAECLDRVQRALADPGPYILLHRTTWTDGSVHWIECRGRVTVDDRGNPTGTVGVALDVTDRERRRAQVAQELEAKRDVVDTLQQALLPARIPTVPGVEIAARYQPARSVVVGGDWYAVVPLAGGRLGLGIGDVAGHGLEAVEAMASARFSLRALALSGDPAEQVLGRLDQALGVFDPATLMTAMYGILDPIQRSWSFANAGHCPPMVRNADGEVRSLAFGPQPPVGVGASYEANSSELEAGSTLVLYTDGLVKRRGEPIDAGFDRLREVLQDGPPDPESLADHLLARLITAESNDDDVALVVVAVA